MCRVGENSMREATISNSNQIHVIPEITEVVDWGAQVLGAPQVWQQTKGKGVKIAVLDTGIDTNHPDLKPNIHGGINFTNGNLADFEDRQGHGTHCAGVIAGVDNEFGVIGVAPEASIYAVKVLGDDGYGSLNTIIKGIRWAIEQRVDVISLSLGIAQRPPQVFHNIIKEAYRRGIVVVAAAGNENDDVCYPAVYPESIAVGAINQVLSKAQFSNHGNELDISAPGVDIYSTFLNGTYAKMSGTSMATPLVAGAIALWIANKRLNNERYTVQDVHYALAKSARDIGTKGYDPQTGHGLLDIVKFLDM